MFLGSVLELGARRSHVTGSATGTAGTCKVCEPAKRLGSIYAAALSFFRASLFLRKFAIHCQWQFVHVFKKFLRKLC